MKKLQNMFKLVTTCCADPATEPAGVTEGSFKNSINLSSGSSLVGRILLVTEDA